MIKLLHTNSPEGGSVPVVVDSDDGELSISRFVLSRGIVEGASGAFKAEAFFDASTVDLPPAEEYEVYVYVTVLAENRPARMVEFNTVRRIEDLGSSWDFATNSAGEGPVHAIHVKTSVQQVP